MDQSFQVELLAKVGRTTGSGCGGGACPAVLKTSRGSYVIVGLKLAAADKAIVCQPGKAAIAADEDAVEIPAELVEQLISRV